jgi:hypothetical protein
MAALTFREHFIEQATAKSRDWSRLNYTFRRSLSVIPAGIGHLLDAALGWDGLWEDKNNYMAGPFGLVFGIIPLLFGAMIGQAADIFLRIPALFGYVLDRALSAMGVFTATALLARYTMRPPGSPEDMAGWTGLVLGFLPNLLRDGLIYAGAFLTSISLPIDRLAEAIRGRSGGGGGPGVGGC